MTLLCKMLNYDFSPTFFFHKCKAKLEVDDMLYYIYSFLCTKSHFPSSST